MITAAIMKNRPRIDLPREHPLCRAKRRLATPAVDWITCSPILSLPYEGFRRLCRRELILIGQAHHIVHDIQISLSFNTVPPKRASASP